jgi:energy-converting hydrogenase Eha subunit C
LNKSVALTSLAWGLFFIVIGVTWAASAYGYYSGDVIPVIALSAGIILIVVSIARTTLGMSLNKFSLFIGIIAFAFGGTALLGVALPPIPTIIVLIGLFIVAEAVRSLTRKKS